MNYVDLLEINSETRKIQDTEGRAMICINVESTTTATVAHNKGTFFIYDGVLYKATSNIAIGDTITVGTNCEVSSLTNALEHVQDSIVVDTSISSSSTNPVQNRVIAAALANKQNTLTFDDAPAINSSNPVKSSGIKAAIDTVDNNVKAGDEAKKSYHLGFYIGEDGGLCQSND